MKKGKGADDAGIVAELRKFGGEEIECEIANIVDNVMRSIQEVHEYLKNSKIMYCSKRVTGRCQIIIGLYVLLRSCTGDSIGYCSHAFIRNWTRPNRNIRQVSSPISDVLIIYSR